MIWIVYIINNKREYAAINLKQNWHQRFAWNPAESTLYPLYNASLRAFALQAGLGRTSGVGLKIRIFKCPFVSVLMQPEQGQASSLGRTMRCADMDIPLSLQNNNFFRFFIPCWLLIYFWIGFENICCNPFKLLWNANHLRSLILFSKLIPKLRIYLSVRLHVAHTFDRRDTYPGCPVVDQYRTFVE